MLNNKKIVVVMPAYNAEKTLKKTYAHIPHEIVDDIILVDDRSSDKTTDCSRKLNIKTFIHNRNRGYGGNQKTCYTKALDLGADVVVMLHPDYQYDPRLITAMSSMITEEIYDIVLGSRILGGESIKNGMPIYKYASNRLLTMFENFITRKKISEYHTGYRAFSRQVLETLPLEKNSDDFIFDNQVLAQAIYFGFTIGEVSCPTRYETDSSSINFRRSLKYGLGVILVSFLFALAKSKIYISPLFKK